MPSRFLPMHKSRVHDHKQVNIGEMLCYSGWKGYVINEQNVFG